MSQTTLKLSNVLYRFDDFHNKSKKLSIDLDEIEYLFEQWDTIREITIDNQFIPSEHIDLSKEILEEILNNFGDYKNIFDYTMEEMFILCPENELINYDVIYKSLIKIYGLEDENHWYIDKIKSKITEKFGKEESYSGSADWGGIPVWAVKGDRFEGTFIIIDDNHDVILMTREFEEESEENIDNYLITASDYVELDNLFNKALEIKNGVEDLQSIVEEVFDESDIYDASKLLAFLQSQELSFVLEKPKNIRYEKSGNPFDVKHVTDIYVGENILIDIYKNKNVWDTGKNANKFHVSLGWNSNWVGGLSKSDVFFKFNIDNLNITEFKNKFKIAYNEFLSNIDYEKIRKFINSNSYFDDESDEDAILFTTRENGDVGAETPGEKDIKEAKKIQKMVIKYYGVLGVIEEVDEFVYYTLNKK